MANASISGLVSGLDTATIVSQLMQVEANPQTLLKTKVSSEKSALSSLQSLNAKLLTIATRATDLAKVTAWSPFTAVSSHDSVSARVLPDGTPGSVSFTVRATATASRLTFDRTELTSRVTDAASTKVRVDFADGSHKDLETGDGTLNGLVKAINAGSTGLRATTIDVGGGQHRVIIESTSTGSASGFSISTNTDDAATPDVVETAALTLSSASVVGADAKIEVDQDVITSSTNTFAGKISGLDITLSPSTPADTVVTVTVNRDTSAMTDSVKALVDAANAVLTDIGTLTAYKTSTSTGGVLAGDPTLRALREDLLSSVAAGVDGKSLADLGIEVDRYGKITFDAEAFKAAYTADPSGTAGRFAGTAEWTDDPADPNTGSVALTGFSWRTAVGPYAIDSGAGTIDGSPATVTGSLLAGKSGTRADGLALTVTGTAVGTVTYTQGLAAKLAAIAERASDSTTGTVTAAVKGRTTKIDSLEDAIAGWDVRLSQRRDSLERQYAALEVALGKLQNQSSWLASQIAGLPSYDSGS